MKLPLTEKVERFIKPKSSLLSPLSKLFQFLKETCCQHWYIFDSGDKSGSDVPSSCAHEHSALLPQLLQSRPWKRWKNQVSFSKSEARQCGLPQKSANGAGKNILKSLCYLPPHRKSHLQPALCLPLPFTSVDLPATSCCCNTLWTICYVHCHVSSFEWLLLTSQPSGDCSSDGQVPCDPCLWFSWQNNPLGNGSSLGPSWRKKKMSHILGEWGGFFWQWEIMLQ